MKKTKKCVLCGKKIKGWGNNPYPLAEKGECCNACNEKVIAARIAAAYSRKEG